MPNRTIPILRTFSHLTTRALFRRVLKTIIDNKLSYNISDKEAELEKSRKFEDASHYLVDQPTEHVNPAPDRLINRFKGEHDDIVNDFNKMICDNRRRTVP